MNKPFFSQAWDAIEKRNKDQEKAMEKLKWEYLFSDRKSVVEETLELMRDNSNTNLELADHFFKLVSPVIVIDKYVPSPKDGRPF